MNNQISQKIPKHGSHQQVHRGNLEDAVSPFTKVKLDLGFLVIFGVVLWVITNSIISPVGKQLLYLAGYSMSGAFWIVFRTRLILKHLLTGQN